MTKKVLTLSLLLMMVSLSSCEKDDKDDKGSSGSLEATIEGNTYSYNLNEGLYSTVTQRLILRANCDCPYSLQFRVYDGLSARTISTSGEQGQGTYGSMDITFHDLDREPKVAADTAVITIDSHNEATQTISGSFSFSKYSNSQNKTYEGSGTFKNAYYD